MAETDIDDYSKLTTDLFGRLASEQDVEKIAKYSEALAHVTEARKTGLELKTAPGSVRLEALKSWSAILVPFLSILTLSVTLWSQREQISASQTGNEDQQWHDMLKSLPEHNANYRSDVEIVSELKPFFKSARYHADARDLSIHLLRELTNESLYDDLYRAAFADPKVQDINDLARLHREIYDSYSNAADDLKRFQAAKATAKNGVVPAARPYFGPLGIPQKSTEELLQQESDADLAKMKDVGSLIATLLRKRVADDDPVDLSDLAIYQLDLHDIDFRGGKMDDASIQYANFTNAIIPDTTGTTAEKWSLSQWWRAAHIDGKLLVALMRTRYPNYFFEPENYDPTLTYAYSEGPVSEKQYIVDAQRLCASANIVCAKKDFRVGPSNPPQQPSAPSQH